MSDDKTKRGKQDRAKVHPNEIYEVRTVAEKFGVTQAFVRTAVRAVGNNRKLVYRYIEHALKDKRRKVRRKAYAGS